MIIKINEIRKNYNETDAKAANYNIGAEYINTVYSNNILNRPLSSAQTSVPHTPYTSKSSLVLSSIDALDSWNCDTSKLKMNIKEHREFFGLITKCLGNLNHELECTPQHNEYQKFASKILNTETEKTDLIKDYFAPRYVKSTDFKFVTMTSEEHAQEITLVDKVVNKTYHTDGSTPYWNIGIGITNATTSNASSDLR